MLLKYYLNKFLNNYKKILLIIILFYITFYALWSCAYKTSDKGSMKGEMKELPKPIISYDNEGDKSGGDNCLFDIYSEDGIIKFKIRGIEIKNLNEANTNRTSSKVFLGSGSAINKATPQDYLVKNKKLFIPKDLILPFKYYDTIEDNVPHEGGIPGEINNITHDKGDLEIKYDGLHDRLNWGLENVNRELQLYLAYNSGKQTSIVGGFNSKSKTRAMKPITKVPEIIRKALEKTPYNKDKTNKIKSIYIGEIIKAESKTRTEAGTKTVKVINKIKIRLDQRFLNHISKTGDLYIVGTKKINTIDGGEKNTRQTLIDGIKKSYGNTKKLNKKTLAKSILSNPEDLEQSCPSYKQKGDFKDYNVYNDNEILLIPINKQNLNQEFEVEFEIDQAELKTNLTGKYQIKLACIDNFDLKIENKKIKVPVMSFSGSKELNIRGRYVSLKLIRPKGQQNNNYKYNKQASFAAEFNGLFYYDLMKGEGSNTITLGATILNMKLNSALTKTEQAVEMESDGFDKDEPVYPFWILVREDEIDDFLNNYEAIEKQTKTFAQRIQDNLNPKGTSTDKPYYISKNGEYGIIKDGNINYAKIEKRYMILSGGKMRFEDAEKFFTKTDNYKLSFNQMADGKGLSESGTSKFNIMHRLGEEDNQESKNYYVIPAIVVPNKTNPDNKKIHNMNIATTYFLDKDSNSTFESYKKAEGKTAPIDSKIKEALKNEILYLAQNAFQGIIGGIKKKPKFTEYIYKSPTEQGDIKTNKKHIRIKLKDDSTKTEFNISKTDDNYRSFRYYYGVNVGELPPELVMEYLNLMREQQDYSQATLPEYLKGKSDYKGLLSIDIDNPKLELNPQYHGDLSMAEHTNRIHVNTPNRGIILMKDDIKNPCIFTADMEFDVNKETIPEEMNGEDILKDPCRLNLDTKSEEKQWIEKGRGRAYDAEKRERGFYTDRVPPGIKIAFSATHRFIKDENEKIGLGIEVGGRSKARLNQFTAIGWSRAFHDLYKDEKGDPIMFGLPSRGGKEDKIDLPNDETPFIKVKPNQASTDSIFSYNDKYKHKFMKDGEKIESGPLINIFAYWKGNMAESLSEKSLNINKIDKTGTLIVNTIKYSAESIEMKNKNYETDTKILYPLKVITPEMLLYLSRFTAAFALVSKNIDKSQVMSVVNDIITKDISKINSIGADEYQNLIGLTEEQIYNQIYFSTINKNGSQNGNKCIVLYNAGNIAYDGKYGYSSIYPENGYAIDHSKDIPKKIENRGFRHNHKRYFPNICALHKKIYIKILKAKDDGTLDTDPDLKDFKNIAEGELIICFDEDNLNNIPDFGWGILKNLAFVSLSRNVKLI